MTTKEIKGLDIKVYNEELENGLKIYLIPVEDRNNYYVEYLVKYGAEVEEFISRKTGKKTKPPLGVAHFLEHKMFEQEDGLDPFSFYSNTGTDANASTGYRSTSYTLEGVNSLEENLDFLLDYVNSPYFTDENVEKEKGIIIEELNMYKDQPENILYEEGNKALFKKHPMRYDIGGTPTTVKKITKEILYECYDTFYQPNNEVLLIAGCFDKDKVMKVIKKNKKLNSRKNEQIIQTFKVNEPLEVNKKEVTKHIDKLVFPKFVLSIKSPLDLSSKEGIYKHLLSIDMLLQILYGPSSLFREEMLEKQLYTLFYTSSVKVDSFFLVEFVSETKFPNEFKELVLKELKEKEITEKDVERIKKSRIAQEVMESDKAYKILDMIGNHIIDYGDVIYNKLDIIRNITLKDINEAREKILFDNYSYTLGLPKNNN